MINTCDKWELNKDYKTCKICEFLRSDKCDNCDDLDSDFCIDEDYKICITCIHNDKKTCHVHKYLKG